MFEQNPGPMKQCKTVTVRMGQNHSSYQLTLSRSSCATFALVCFDTLGRGSVSFFLPGLGPKQQKFNEMNGAHLASPIRGELGYAHWPQLGTQFIALLGTIRETRCLP